jgi:hypothetical protein
MATRRGPRRWSSSLVWRVRSAPTADRRNKTTVPDTFSGLRRGPRRWSSSLVWRVRSAPTADRRNKTTVPDTFSGLWRVRSAPTADRRNKTTVPDTFSGLGATTFQPNLSRRETSAKGNELIERMINQPIPPIRALDRAPIARRNSSRERIKVTGGEERSVTSGPTAPSPPVHRIVRRSVDYRVESTRLSSACCAASREG